MKILAIIILSIYLLGFLLVLGVGQWRQKKKQRKFLSENTKIPLEEITVVIPFRNESKRINRLIKSLNESTKLPGEILFIDDHSDDNTCEIILQSLKIPHRILTLKDNFQGKKRALQQGIQEAKGKYILTLDADVYFSSNYFENVEQLSKADLYLLPAVLKAEKAWQHLLEIDLLLINAINTGLCGLKRPIIASGANMLFNKEAYQNHHQLESHIHVPSGDDIYLLRDFRKAKLDVRVMALNDFSVSTETPQNISDFFHQRVRWIAKTSDVKDHLSTTLAVFQSILTLSLITIMVFALISAKWKLFAFVFLSKTLFDMLLFGSFFLHFKRPIAFCLIPLYQFLFPIYNLILLFVLPFFKPKWKGRNAGFTPR